MGCNIFPLTDEEKRLGRRKNGVLEDGGHVGFDLMMLDGKAKPAATRTSAPRDQYIDRLTKQMPGTTELTRAAFAGDQAAQTALEDRAKAIYDHSRDKAAEERRNTWKKGAQQAQDIRDAARDDYIMRLQPAHNSAGRR